MLTSFYYDFLFFPDEKIWNFRFKTQNLKFYEINLSNNEEVLFCVQKISKDFDKKIDRYFLGNKKIIQVDAESFHNFILSLIENKKISKLEKERIKSCYFFRRQSFLNELSKHMKKYNFTFCGGYNDNRNTYLICEKKFLDTDYYEKAFIGSWIYEPLASFWNLKNKMKAENIEAEFINLK